MLIWLRPVHLGIEPSKVWLVTNRLVPEFGFSEAERNGGSITLLWLFRQLEWLLNSKFRHCQTGSKITMGQCPSMHTLNQD